MKPSGKTSYIRQYLFGFLSTFWHIFKKQKKHLIVFTAFHGDGYRGNTKILYEQLQNDSELEVIWLTRNKALAQQLKSQFGQRRVALTHSINGLNHLASAGAILLTHGTDDYPFMHLPRRAEIIQTYHGLPTKRGEYMRPKSDKPPWAFHKLILEYRFNPIDYFLSSSEIVTGIFSQRFGIDKSKFVLTGYPAYDELTDGKKSKSDLQSLFPGLPDFKHAILYAPTFRKKSTTKWFPFDDYNPSEINRFLEEHEAVLILRPHPNEKIIIKDFSTLGDRVVQGDQSKIENINDLLKMTDCIVTDYSGIYIEGLLLDIPSVFIPYDLNEYERGLPLPYDDVTPGPKVQHQTEFINALKISLNDTEKFKTERSRVRKLFFEEQSNNATNSTIKFLKTILLKEWL